MKHRLQTLLKHKLQWLVLLTALLGMSQGVLGYQGTWLVGSWDDYSAWTNIQDNSTKITLTAGTTYYFDLRRKWDDDQSKYHQFGCENCAAGDGVQFNTYRKDGIDNKVKITATTTGEYEFKRTGWDGDAPQITVYFPVALTSYCVAGDGDSNWLNNQTWNNNYADNCLDSNGEITFNNVPYKSGGYTFAIVVKGSWSPSFRYSAYSSSSPTSLASGDAVVDKEDGDHNVKITLKDGGGNKNITIKFDRTNIYVITTVACSKPSVSFDSPVTSVCSGTTQSYTAIGTTSSGTISSYTWGVSGTGWSRSDSGTSASATFNTGTGTGTITVTATNSCGSESDAASQTVTIKGTPSAPSFSSGATKLCENVSENSYVITGTADAFIWENNGNGISWHSTPASSDKTVKVDVASSITDEATTYVRVKAQNCSSLNSDYATKNITLYKSASAGTVNLTKNSVCVNESGITASRAGTWYSGGGTFQWSSASTTYATVSDASDTSPTITAKKPTPSSVNITCAINSPTCGSTTNNSAALTINGPEAFTIGASPASPKPWEVVTLSTSPSTSATWSITANPSGKAYLSTTSGTSTKLKAPYDASSYTVKASATSGGCTQENTKNVTISSESCE